MFKTLLYPLVIYYINIIIFVSPTIFVKAPCPNVTPVSNYDWERYKGLWFEIGRYPDDWEKQGDCPTIEYYESDGHMFNVTYVQNKKRFTFNGAIDVGPGILTHKAPNFNISGSQKKLPVHIIDVAYDDYAIAYQCFYDGTKKIRQDYIWLLTRSHAPSAKTRKKIDDVIQSASYIDKTKLVIDHLTDDICLF